MRWRLVAGAAVLVAGGVAAWAIVMHRSSVAAVPVAHFTVSTPPAKVTIAGRVLERKDQEAIGGVQIVFHGPNGDLDTTTSADGSYSIIVPPARYRVYVIDEHVMSVGMPDRVRLDNGPRDVLISMADETLMPVLDATADARDVDLEVVHVARLLGRVIDFESNPISGAIVRASGGTERPVLGTDTARTNAQGEVELRVPEGRYAVDVAHPKFATSTPRLVVINPRVPMTSTFELDPGCVISGRVVAADGSTASGGAIERDVTSAVRFGPAGRVASDGTFRFSTLDRNDVTVRAWPWMSPASRDKTFSCTNGARFDHVQLDVPARSPSMTGSIVDLDNTPVPFVHLDIKALDGTPNNQQERADAGGKWNVYEAPAGRYEITASMPGHGIVVVDAHHAQRDIKLQFSGTGRIAGTVTNISEGAFAVAFTSCSDAFDSTNHPLGIAHEPRIVVVHGGRFAIDGAPACHLAFVARWHGTTVETNLDVVANRTAMIELDLGKPISSK